MKNYTILARRWFDKINGNTYHSVKVYVNNKFVDEEKYSYGYGKQYLQTAHELLMKNGFLKKTRDNFIIDCVDVQRKKDL